MKWTWCVLQGSCSSSAGLVFHFENHERNHWIFWETSISIFHHFIFYQTTSWSTKKTADRLTLRIIVNLHHSVVSVSGHVGSWPQQTKPSSLCRASLLLFVVVLQAERQNDSLGQTDTSELTRGQCDYISDAIYPHVNRSGEAGNTQWSEAGGSDAPERKMCNNS